MPDRARDEALNATETPHRPPNLHELHTADSTRKMLQAAGDLIVEVGYHKMTLAAIGERAGYSRGLATMRFGSKKGLLQRLVESSMTDWLDRRATARFEGQSGCDAAIALLASTGR